MSRYLAPLVAGALALAATSLAHAEEALDGAEIKALIGGKGVLLATPYGLEFPLVYQSNGRVVGDASGFTMASMFAPKETGKWWVEGKRLCQQWPTWYDGKPLCFTVRQTGENTISWTREDGLSGTARIRS